MSQLNYEKVYNTMVEHAINYITKCNLHSAVLGISGGIDSTIVACIFSKVSEILADKGYKFTFVGASMPTETTDKREFEISQMVLNSFCDEQIIMDITEEANFMYQHINRHVFPAIISFDDTTAKYRRGNIKSRLRMMHLYDIAKAKGGIVLGTDNQTEYMLGYSTIGGDGLFDYNPIQYLWKTEVYGLAKYLVGIYQNENKRKLDALNASIEIPPQAGLGISSTDLEEIGISSYELLDGILQKLIECSSDGIERYTHHIDDIIAFFQDNTTYNIDDVVIVWKRLKANAYKRILPICVKRNMYE